MRMVGKSATRVATVASWSDQQGFSETRLTHPRHSGYRHPFPPLDDHVTRTPEIGHFVLKDAAGEWEDAVQDMKKGCGKGSKPRSEHQAKGHHCNRTELGEVYQPAISLDRANDSPLRSAEP